MRKIFTSESVTEGHPDKICDQISDAILDEILKQDANARVACDTVVNTGLVMVVGEITTTAYVEIRDIVREKIKQIGYDGLGADAGFDCESCAVLVSIDKQSTDIAAGVDGGDDIGAGDQGMMYGYACTETKELMPLPISLAHKLTERLSQVRKNGTLPYLRPDGKAQVTVEYLEGEPVSVNTVVVSTQHAREISQDQIKKDIVEHVINAIIPAELLKNETNYHINPAGPFVTGGPKGDSGLTGRKIIVDTYGGYARHGGGAFSGKDGTKVDRSGAYMARYIAKNIVAAGLAKRCEVELAYAIGVAQPVSVSVRTENTSQFTELELEQAVRQVFDMRPAAIIKTLELTKPNFSKVSAYGHFGRENMDIPWERTDMIDQLKKALS